MGWLAVDSPYKSKAMSDLTKAPAQIIVDMINGDNTSAGLTTADLTLGSPVDISGSNAVRNTELLVQGKAGGRYGGQVYIRYNRVNIAQVLATGSAAFLKGSATQVSEVVAALNARFGVNLIAGTDYDDEALPTFTGLPGEEHTFVLTIKPGSLVFIGSTTVTVKIDTIDLATVITIEDLSGLTYVPPGG